MATYFRHLGFMCCMLLLALTLQGQNAIVTENALPGSPASEWDILGSGDPTIQGFATDMSVNKGGTIRFKVMLTGSNRNFSTRIYRLGYYQGNGARLVATIATRTAAAQPSPSVDVNTGLVDYGNWSVSASWVVPTTAVSGIYIARIERQDNGGASHIVFVVRDDASTSAILFKTADATWQAYNSYGGYSFYGGSTGNPTGRADKLSYNRPFNTRSVKPECFLFNAEYPMVRWLERNGYDLTYVTDVDMERTTTTITPSMHRILLSVGHDEYWSLNMRNNFENARNAGVHLAFFSGNEVYWKTRWENGNRTLVCYKEGLANQGEFTCGGNCDPVAGVWTGLWRYGCEFGEDACRPENSLTGQLSWTESSLAMKVPYEFRDLPFWRNTSVATLQPGQEATMTDQTLGYEWNYEQPAFGGSYPASRVALSRTTSGGLTHMASLYTHSSGAIVFGAGTVQWSWGLDNEHDRGNPAPSRDMQQATTNLFLDMGVSPATPPSDIIIPLPPPPPSGYTIFTNQNPAIQNQRDNTTGIVVGTRFRSTVAGNVTAIRFYKGAGNTGTHIGQLWTATGTLLAQATFSNETTSGWQQVNLSNPVAINASTDYIVSYHSSQGYYSVTGGFFNNQVVNSPLTAPADLSSAHNGVYRYSTTPAFPNDTYGRECYFVDVVFSTGSSQDQTAPTVSAVSPASGASGVAIAVAPTADFSEALDPASVSTANAFIRNGSTTIAAAVSYSSSNNRVTITPSASLANGVTYTVTLKGGTGGLRDMAGNVLATDYSWTFTTVAAPVQTGNCPCTVFTSSQPVQPSSSEARNDGAALNIGMKFTVMENGSITALRFYKSLNHSGTHTGQLYSSSGTLLASAVFTNETASGWQEVNLSTPVSVTAGNSYVVSYHSALGNYSTTPGYFTSSVTNGALTAPSSASSGGNGVYTYGGPAMPVNSWNSSNYWVDVVFNSAAVQDQTPPTVSTVTPAPSATGVATTGTVNADFSEPLDVASVTTTNAFIRNGGTTIAATVSYSSSNNRIILTPAAALSNSTTYTVTLKGGAGGLRDLAGNQLAADYNWTFTTVAAPVQTGICPCTVFTSSQDVQPSASEARNDGTSLNIGMKFSVAENGYITALRFYKSLNHSGTHTGQLYSAGGTLLASAVFTNETASGWQQVSLATPVAVTAGATYTVSYHSALGNYSTTPGYFNTSVVNGPLTAPSSGSSGGNGVYSYGPAAMPVNSWNASNYWVDVVFNNSISGASVPGANNAPVADIALQPGTGTGTPSAYAPFQLGQNVPNPAKQGTSIPYSLSTKGHVTMRLYDIHGRLLRVLVDDDKQPGSYKLDVDVRNLPAGVYYYRLISNSGTAVRRLIVE